MSYEVSDEGSPCRASSRKRLPREEVKLYEKSDKRKDGDIERSEESIDNLKDKRREYVFGDGSRLEPASIEDLQGLPHITKQIEKYIRFLSNYTKFKEKGVRVQPGIFLRGKPGTGKTLTARIIATESGAKLIDAGKFPRENDVWKSNDIKSIFNLAREYHSDTGEPVIIYFDEIDAVCPDKRRHNAGTTSTMLAELDGMGGKPKGIFVIASASSLDIDEALLRAGRLGHHIRYKPPGLRGRKEIFEYYIERKPHRNIDVESIARILNSDATPAEIEELIEKAYMDASLRETEPELKESDIVKQLLRNILGSPSGTWVKEEERYRACVHEAGHVVVASELELPVKLTVVPKKGYQKGTTAFDSSDKGAPKISDLENKISAAYGGEVAEEIVFGERKLGSKSDTRKATEESIDMAFKLSEDTNYRECRISNEEIINPLGDSERERMYDEAKELRGEALEKARSILEDFDKEKIEKVADEIKEREFLLMNDLKELVSNVEEGD